MRAASLGNSPLQVTSPFFVVTSRLAVFTCGSENILAFTAVVICWSLGAFEQAAASPRTITSATSKIADLRIVPPCCIEPSRGPEVSGELAGLRAERGLSYLAFTVLRCAQRANGCIRACVWIRSKTKRGRESHRRRRTRFAVRSSRKEGIRGSHLAAEAKK